MTENSSCGSSLRFSLPRGRISTGSATTTCQIAHGGGFKTENIRSKKCNFRFCQFTERGKYTSWGEILYQGAKSALAKGSTTTCQIAHGGGVKGCKIREMFFQNLTNTVYREREIHIRGRDLENGANCHWLKGGSVTYQIAQGGGFKIIQKKTVLWVLCCW